MQAVGQVGHFLPMWIQQSLCTTAPSLLDQKTVSAWNFKSTWKFKYLTPRRVLMEFSSIKKPSANQKKNLFFKRLSRQELMSVDRRREIKSNECETRDLISLFYSDVERGLKLKWGNRERKKKREREIGGSILASIPSCHGFDSPEIFLSVKNFWCCQG